MINKIELSFSRCDSFRISWEKRSVSDVLQPTEQHNDSFESNSSSTVWIGSVFETVNIIFNSFWINSFSNSSLSKDNWVMNSLSATQNFLSSHEEIIRASESWVIFANSCIERSSFNRISVKHIKISIVFLSN